LKANVVKTFDRPPRKNRDNTPTAGEVGLGTSGPNAVANHGGIGLLVGLASSFIFVGPLKGGQIFFLSGAFLGAVFGLVIGVTRRSIAEAHVASQDASGAEGNEHHMEQDGS
jgi:hypothetical protein